MTLSLIEELELQVIALRGNSLFNCSLLVQRAIDAIQSLEQQLAALKAQPGSGGEYGDAYQGAREDLAIWKRRALEAEAKIREQDQIIENLGNALNDENGPTFMGEPVIRAGGVDERAAHVPDEVFEAEFLAWWESDGQFCRAGGGNYERTFAFQAWRHLYPMLMQARAALAQSERVPDVSAMARVLSDRSADACNIDRTDNWAMYGQEYIEDVQAMLAAAPSPSKQGGVSHD
ncbi:hypothetical protein [Pseudomonas xionganensis]|uniref:hypothetical protein n=1 Tax=Pseudomonas xionganensis TaxID=2654845 RepID=UPI0015B3FA34|nr:hypothetical protein [Pseudomonas xionganensis]